MLRGIQLIKPSWYFKPIDVPELPDIQSEIIKILPQLILPNEEFTFFYIKREQIEDSVPSYRAMLSRLNLLDRWTYSAVVTTQGEKEFPIHVDSLDWENRCYGLNLPILNCEDSYTVWYDAIATDTPSIYGENLRASARFYDTKTAKEVCRMPATTSAWINNSIPHRPVTNHTEFRAIISARFSPEVHDLINT